MEREHEYRRNEPSMTHSFEHNGETYRVYVDEFHDVRGSFALDTEEETLDAENETLDMLASGEWIALCVDVVVPCDACGGDRHLDALSGIVINNDTDAWERELPGILGR